MIKYIDSENLIDKIESRMELRNDVRNADDGYYPESKFMICDDKDDEILSIIDSLQQEQDMGEVSDGYHTFNELYYYRMLYNAAFFNLLPKEWVHKSKRHHTGEECFGGGWFIVMANLPTGQISNHYELKDWDLFRVPEKEFADEWDGHTPQEAAKRLHEYLQQKQSKENKLPSKRMRVNYAICDLQEFKSLQEAIVLDNYIYDESKSYYENLLNYIHAIPENRIAEVRHYLKEQKQWPYDDDADWVEQEYFNVDLEKFTEKIDIFTERYKNNPERVSIKGAMAFMARMFYQYPNAAREWYENLPKATMD